jgi:hypothetical protein
VRRPSAVAAASAVASLTRRLAWRTVHAPSRGAKGASGRAGCATRTTNGCADTAISVRAMSCSGETIPLRGWRVALTVPAAPTRVGRGSVVAYEAATEFSTSAGSFSRTGWRGNSSAARSRRDSTFTTCAATLHARTPATWNCSSLTTMPGFTARGESWR